MTPEQRAHREAIRTLWYQLKVLRMNGNRKETRRAKRLIREIRTHAEAFKQLEKES